jgi:hypothetical protein
VKVLLTINEAVEALGGTISRTSIWRECRNGSIPARQIGSRWVIPGWWINDQIERPLTEQHL